MHDIVQRHHIVVPDKVVVGAVRIRNISDVVAEGEDALQLVDGRTIGLVPKASRFQRLPCRLPASDLTDQVAAVFAFPAF